jgi:hypothetical protein
MAAMTASATGIIKQSKIKGIFTVLFDFGLAIGPWAFGRLCYNVAVA